LEWKKYLRRDFPCVLFKANTQNQNSNLSSNSVFNSTLLENKDYIEDILNSSKAVGGENLLNLLKNYCRIEDLKKTITVGIVGFPNVGKSSIINSLKRDKVAGVSSTPGYTKGLQEISLDKNIKLLDCPGVVFKQESEDVILHNVIRTEEIKEPIEVVAAILRKMVKEVIAETYGIPSTWERVEEFLYLIGNKMGKFKKGGLVDLDKTARVVLKDWNEGKLKYYTIPPQVEYNEVTTMTID
jgi:nuclear GTP-binding protein